jgi:hypothetical protein
LPNPGQAESDATDRSQAEFDNQLGAYTELRDAIFGAKTGLSYVAALRRILADLSEADRAASGEFASPTGELIVSAPTELGRLHIIPILAEFLRAYPDIDSVSFSSNGSSACRRLTWTWRSGSACFPTAD